jgi:zinc transporter 1/2/3
MAPAHEALSNPCLTGPITEYTWVEGIALMTIFVLFFVEIMAMRFATFGHDHDHEHVGTESQDESVGSALPKEAYQDEPATSKEGEPRLSQNPRGSFAPGNDHLGHTREHHDIGQDAKDVAKPKKFDADSYAARMTALMVLEFGIIFHSVFIGLTLAVAGEEFITLYIVLVFHQTFEGLALGSRLGSMTWPASKRWTPYLMGIGYGLSTPIAIAIGLGVRTTFNPNSQTTLIVNGVFDSLSAGILIYTGLVEVMAHEFIFNAHSR